MVAADVGRTLRRVSVAVVGFATALACFDVHGKDLLEDARRAGKVTVGYANIPPYGFTTPAGEPAGEAWEIARLILSRMGIKEVEAVVSEPAALIADLQAGRFDMIATGMIVVPRRCADVLFSEPTFGVAEAFVVRSGNPKELEDFADVAASEDAIVAVMPDAVEADYARRSGVPGERILVVPDAAAGMAAVRSGMAHAFATTSPGAAASLRAAGEGSGLERTAPFTMSAGGAPARAHGAFAFRNQDAAFAAEFNRHLKDFIGSSGHLALIERFGLGEADLPERTAAELCQPAS